jgi:2-methylisocitrate lyase-like PEP mutase family enzyme
MNRTEKLNSFKALHLDTQPLLLGNVWDAHSAILAEKAGFKALGTSSHAIAIAMGYHDGEEISFDEMLFVVQRIINAVNIPVSVDFEAGYSSNYNQVVTYVKQLVKAGAVGINIEDSIVKEGKRQLDKADNLIGKIKAIVSETNVFINARTDTYTTKHLNALNESIERALAYKKAGAHGIFVPLIETEKDIKAFVTKVEMPLNVFTTNQLPHYEALTALGVKRISHGAKQYELLMKKSETIFKDFYKTKDYQIVMGQ